MLHSLLQMDVQILRSVVIIHVLRHVKVDAANQIDGLFERLEINEHITINREAKQTLKA